MDRSPASAEDGFSLIEVIVAMLLLLVLATFTLPLFMTAVATSADNTSATSGTAAVAAVLDEARGIVQANQSSGACAKLKAFASSVPSMTTFKNAQGRTLALTMSTPTCTPGTPAAVTLSVAAPNANPSSSARPSPVEPSATTIIYVGS